VFKTNTAASNIAEYYDVVSAARTALEKSDLFTASERDLICTMGFGHMADGDIHINIGV